MNDVFNLLLWITPENKKFGEAIKRFQSTQNTKSFEDIGYSPEECKELREMLKVEAVNRVLEKENLKAFEVHWR